MKPFFFCPQKISGGKCLLFLFSLALVLQGFFPKTCFADGKSIFNTHKDSVVIVYVYDRKGDQITHASGFIARKDGVVITNFHVLNRAARIKVKAKGRMLEVKGMLYSDRKNDIAILKTEGKNLPEVKIHDADIGAEGQKIYMIGSPGGEEKILFDGTLSRIADIAPGRKLLRITAPVTKGCSGGPVFNEDGEVIGIATFFMDEAQSFYFAMPVDRIKSRLSLKKFVPLYKAKLTAPEDTAGYWFNLGAVYESLGLYADASGAYQKAIGIDPSDAAAHHNLGVVYTHLTIYSFAIRELSEAIRLKPSDAKAHHNLAIAFFMSGKYKEAVKAFTQTIRIKPDYPEAYYNLGIVYYRMNMNKDAAQAFKETIRMKPDFSKAHFWLGVIYSTQDEAAARKEYEILKDLDHSDALVLQKIMEARADISSAPPVLSPDASQEKLAGPETTYDSSGEISAPVVQATTQKEVYLPHTLVPPSKGRVPPDGVAATARISNQKTSGKRTLHSKKDIYSAQVSVLHNKKPALALARRLRKRGYNAFLIQDKGPRYRVLVGEFSVKEKAIKQSQTLLKKEKLKSIIFRH